MYTKMLAGSYQASIHHLRDQIRSCNPSSFCRSLYPHLSSLNYLLKGEKIIKGFYLTNKLLIPIYALLKKTQEMQQFNCSQMVQPHPLHPYKDNPQNI